MSRFGRRQIVIAAVVGVVVLMLFASRLATFYTDVLWFSSIGFENVFWNLLATQFGLGMVAGVLMTALLGINLSIARRTAPAFRVPSEGEEVVERYRRMVEPIARPALAVVAVLAGLLSGSSMVGQWRTYMLWANAGEFGIEDPHFGRDLGFFVFDLPFLETVNGWLFSALLITILLTALAHYLFGGIRPQAPVGKITAAANIHLSVLLAALVAVRAWAFWLDRYLLSYSERGQVTGLSYTDVHAQLRAFELLTVIAAVCVVLFLANIRYRGWILPSAGVGILLVAALLLGGAYPALIQRLQVDPQELPREEPFIARNLDFTRYGFAIDEETTSYERFAASSELTAEEIEDNTATLRAIRLWDPTTLQNSYEQLQELRPYYDFVDVDVDRYEVDGDPRQVNISVRELNERELPSITWQNQRLVFTHGYAMVASRVSTAAADGQPEFLARNIPVTGVDELIPDEPRIYFGENPPEYSIVDSGTDEFDYETDAEQRFTTYTGADGVGVSGLLRRLAFALRYAEPNIVLSGLIESQSRILYNRQIQERISLIAPFLQLDHDPYPVVANGRILWIQDAYTITDMIPYSERIDLETSTSFLQRQLRPIQQADGSIELVEQVVERRALTGQANYIRNSVKAVVDAYDGTVTLYLTDPDDPLIQAWGRAFPGVLTDVEEAPRELRDHFRYPEDMFRVQAQLLTTYHIPEAAAFYNRSDAWQIPEDLSFEENQGVGNTDVSTPFRPTYQLLRLPDAEREQFALIQPFSPRNREVLSAYMAGTVGVDGSPSLRILQMPPNQTVFGPEQVFARVNQDDEVAAQITLWNASGSSVIYGNIIVLPVADSLLYALPLFLRSQQSEIPELRRVVLVFGDRVIMEPRLAGALEAVFGQLPEELDEGDAPLPDDDLPSQDDDDVPELTGQTAQLLADALEAFAQADAALAEGDLGRYQEQIEVAEELLDQLREELGIDLPEPSATATPTPTPEPTAPSTE